MLSKSKIIRVVKDLDFLSQKNAEEQKKWIDDVLSYQQQLVAYVQTSQEERHKLENAINQMASQNEQLRREKARLSEEKNELESKISTMISYISELSDEKKKISNEAVRQTFSAKLSGGAEFTLIVPTHEVNK